MPVDENFSVEDIAQTTADLNHENLLAGDPAEASDNDLTADPAPEVESDSESAEHDLANQPESAEMTEETSYQEVEEEVEVEAEEKPAKGSRAEKRIQVLADRAKKAEEALAKSQEEFTKRFEALQSNMQQQLSAQTNALQEQVRMQAWQMEQARIRQEQADLSQLTPGQRVERDLIQKTREALMPEIQRRDAHIERLEQERRQMFQIAKDKKELDGWKVRTNEANAAILLKEFDADTQKALADVSRELVMTYGTAFGVNPEPASNKFKEFCEAYHRAKLKTVSRKGAASLKPGQSAPKPLPQGKTSAKGNSRPTPEELTKLGFNNYIEWRKSLPFE